MQATLSTRDPRSATRVTERKPLREQRAHIRWSGDAPYRVLLRQGERILPCGLKDISAGGAALSCGAQLAVGDVAVIEINQYLRLPAIVLRVQTDRIAVQFALAPTLARVIEQAIEMGISPDQW